MKSFVEIVNVKVSKNNKTIATLKTNSTYKNETNKKNIIRQYIDLYLPY